MGMGITWLKTAGCGGCSRLEPRQFPVQRPSAVQSSTAESARPISPRDEVILHAMLSGLRSFSPPPSPPPHFFLFFFLKVEVPNCSGGQLRNVNRHETNMTLNLKRNKKQSESYTEISTHRRTVTHEPLRSQEPVKSSTRGRAIWPVPSAALS